MWPGLALILWRQIRLLSFIWLEFAVCIVRDDALAWVFGSGPPMNASKLSLIYKNYISIPILTLWQPHTTDLPSRVSYSFPWSCSQKQSCLFHVLCSAWEQDQHAVFCGIHKPLCPSLSSPPHLARSGPMQCWCVLFSLHRAAKKFCSMVLLCDVQGNSYQESGPKWVKKISNFLSQISASSTLKCSNMCKSHWLCRLGDHLNGSYMN